jgi:hypothetical protein
MKRVLLLICLSCIPVALAVVSAATARSPRAVAAVDGCHPALRASDRYAVFRGTMRSLRRGADRMHMRFDLYRREKGATAFQPVTAPGLGVWNPANRGVRRFRFRQKVANLSAPAAYRTVVSFRWSDARGRAFARTSRVTGTCVQPDLRADLRISRITGSRLPDGSAFYQVTVRNDGRTAASAFDVRLDVNGAPLVPTQALPALDAGSRQVVAFLGPRCLPGSSLRATADPDNRVEEADERNGTLTVPCPLG